jgi:hypothetical protein
VKITLPNLQVVSCEASLLPVDLVDPMCFQSLKFPTFRAQQFFPVNFVLPLLTVAVNPKKSALEVDQELLDPVLMHIRIH